MKPRSHGTHRSRRDESRESLRLSKTHRRTTYVILAWTWLSGVLWLITHYFFTHTGEFGVEPSALEPWWLRLHGAAAFFSLWLGGLIWAMHARHGITRAKRRPSGLLLIGAFVLLAISGYLLYYLTGDDARDAMRLVHWLLGLAVAIPFLLHSLSARSARKAGLSSLATDTQGLRSEDGV